VKVPTGAFVARRNGKIFITGNSGFPKSLDISKAIDEHLGKSRKVVGPATRHGGGDSKVMVGDYNAPRTAPASPQAVLWDGWGTALKPAHEPIVLARKPFSGTIVAHVLKHGTGGINVGACRLGTTENLGRNNKSQATWGNYGNGPSSQLGLPISDQSRFPPNVLLSHSPACGKKCAPGCPVAALDKQSGILKGGTIKASTVTKGGSRIGTFNIRERTGRQYVGSVGGASKFFPILNWDPMDFDFFRYQAKPSNTERDAGCAGEGTAAEVTGREPDSRGLNNSRSGMRRKGSVGNEHPTVKPITLMGWLCKLITPKGGLILDPFCGSGTTGCAAIWLGFNFIGIDQSAEYAELARGRIAAYEKHLASKHK
jgi:site-specific DNA-methyltransferase (adenine-specific)